MDEQVTAKAPGPKGAVHQKVLELDGLIGVILKYTIPSSANI